MVYSQQVDDPAAERRVLEALLGAQAAHSHSEGRGETFGGHSSTPRSRVRGDVLSHAAPGRAAPFDGCQLGMETG